MRVEVRSISSLKLIPESDSDRAVLTAMVDMRADQSKRFLIQSDTWESGKGLQEITVGYGNRS